MKKPRSKEEIAVEVAKLEKMRKRGITPLRITLVIDELTKGVTDLIHKSPAEREIVVEVRRWKERITEEPPSSGWDALTRA